MKLTPIALTAAVMVSAAGADTLDFSDLSHGDVVAAQYAGQGVNIAAVNFDNLLDPDLAMIFDTSLTGTADGDLEDPFSSGNTDLNTPLGNVLIISENGTPNDEGSRPAGTITFTFDMLVTSFGFHVVDLESETAEQSSLDFYRNGGLVESVDFAEFLAGGSHDNAVIYGNNSINLVNEFAVAGGYDELVINVGGSMGFDNITYTIPTPGALALFGFGGALMSRRRR